MDVHTPQPWLKIDVEILEFHFGPEWNLRPELEQNITTIFTLVVLFCMLLIFVPFKRAFILIPPCVCATWFWASCKIVFFFWLRRTQCVFVRFRCHSCTHGSGECIGEEACRIYWVHWNTLNARLARKSLAESRPATGRSMNPVRSVCARDT